MPFHRFLMFSDAAYYADTDAVPPPMRYGFHACRRHARRCLRHV